MKAIILAAGEGKRLRPLTNDKPKCMVEYRDKPLIDYIIAAIKQNGVEDIAVVGGYKIDVLKHHLRNDDIVFYNNEEFQETNMVYSLFCGKEWMDDDLIVSYSDIVYSKEMLQTLLQSRSDIVLSIDKNWLELWRERFDKPLEDAETLKIVHGNIVEIGRKPASLDDIEGQYIGLIKFSKSILPAVCKAYEKMCNTGNCEDNVKKMYMTDFLQYLINDSFIVKPVYSYLRWLEIDSPSDLQIKVDII